MSLLLMGEVAEAFKPVTFVGKAAPALRNSLAWGAPMKTMMVAGGAERSQGDDYYEGKLCVCRPSMKLAHAVVWISGT